MWLLSDSERRVHEQRLLFRLTCETARHLVLLYPRLDETGGVRRPSPHLVSYLGACTGRSWDAGETAREARKGTRTLGRAEPLPHEHLLGALDRDMAAVGRAITGEDPERTGLYALWSSPSFRWGWHAEHQRWHGGPGPWNGFLDEPEVLRGVLVRMGLEEGAVSATLLQDYAICPWKVLAVRILGLERDVETEEGRLDGAEMGRVLHDVLRWYVTEMDAEGRWPPGPGQETEHRALLEERVRSEVVRAYRRKGQRAPALEEVDIRQGLQRAVSWLAWESGEGIGGDLEDPSAAGWPVQALEEEFEVPLPGRAGLRLKGRWDRLDRGPSGETRIIDYKTGASAPPPEGKVQGGMGLQMPLYLEAAARSREELLGGTFVHLDPSEPGGSPGLRSWRWERVSEDRDRLGGLVDNLAAAMREGVFLRSPHEKGQDRDGLCRGCPSPEVCRAWREEEARRLSGEERMIPLHAARRMDELGGGR